MDFLTKGFNTISNAVEINTLKSDRDELRKKKDEFTNKLNKYNNQIILKTIIENNIESNNKTITNLREQFIAGNIDFQNGGTFDEFILKYSNNSYAICLYKLYLSLNSSNEILKVTNDEISKDISIDREIYVNKINEIDEQIKKVNNKLEKVRDKQFDRKKS